MMKLIRADRTNLIGPTEPQTPLWILQQGVHTIADQAFFHGVLRDLAVLVAEQSVVAGSKLKGSLVILKHGPDFLVLQRAGRCVLHELVTMPVV